MEMKDTLRMLKRKRRMTTEALSRESGVPRGTINKLLNGETTNPTVATLTALAAALHCPVQMLHGNLDGGLPYEPQGKESIGGVFPITKKRVPILGTIAAGTPIQCESEIDVLEGVDDMTCDFALRVQGESMIGARIYSGDVVLVREQPDVDDGEIAAVVIDGAATLKRVYHTRDGLTLLSENPKIAPIFVHVDEDSPVRILGKAVGLYARL